MVLLELSTVSLMPGNLCGIVRLLFDRYIMIPPDVGSKRYARESTHQITTHKYSLYMIKLDLDILARYVGFQLTPSPYLSSGCFVTLHASSGVRQIVKKSENHVEQIF